MPLPETEVAVVGAGASGLATAAALQRRGRTPVVFEADARIGVVWQSRYERLHLHTVRRFSGLPFHALPREYPRYVPKDLYARYLQDYAEQLRLDVRLGHGVERVVRDEQGAWVLTTTQDDSTARAVVVATGRHRVQRLPAWAGMSHFSGRLLHSGDFKSGAEFTGTRALVIGIGNSGAEIAAELVQQQARRVAIAIRTAPPITARELMGVPVQLLGIALAPFPARLIDALGTVMRRIGTGDLRRYGIPAAEWGPFTTRRPPVIDVGFLRELKAGQIDVRPAVTSFTPQGVVFADGLEEPFDVVVAATGFATGLEELVSAPEALDERGIPRASEVSAYPGLFFAGYHESPRGQLFEASRQSRRLARRIDRYLDGRSW